MKEPSREQEAAIARLAMKHSSVSVSPPNDDGTIRVEVSGRTLILDEDGGTKTPPPESGYFYIPLGMLRLLCGDERVDEAVMEAMTRSYPDHSLGMILGDELRERLAALAENQAAVAKGANF